MTFSKYKDGLDFLKVQAPKHPLLPILEQGENAINRLYLKNAIKKLSTEVSPKPPILQVKRITAPHQLYKELKQIYTAKAKCRNGYFLCTTDPQRTTINQNLIQYRAQLHDLHRKIEYYEKTGELPVIPDIEKVLIPDTEYSHKDLANIRSNISRTKKKISKAYTDKRPKTRIEQLEEKLQNFITKKEHIERYIQENDGQTSET